MEWIFLVLARGRPRSSASVVLVVSRRRNRSGRSARPARRRADHRTRHGRPPGRALAPRRCQPTRRGAVSRSRAGRRAGQAGLAPRADGEGPFGVGRCVRRGARTAAAITDETWDELEEALLRADVGVGVTDDLLDDLAHRVKAKEITEPDALLDALQGDDGRAPRRRRPRRCTSRPAEPAARTCGCSSVSTASARPPPSARSRSQQTADGRSVLMAAGDTFRAAAAEQLGDVGRAGRRRARAGRARAAIRAPSSSTASSEPRPRTSISCSPTPPDACTRRRT